MKEKDGKDMKGNQRLTAYENFELAFSAFEKGTEVHRRERKAQSELDPLPAFLQIPGLIVVVSGTAGGKTHLVKSLCEDYGGLFVEFLEPTRNSARSVSELRSIIEQAALNQSDANFLAIDSLRIPQFEAPGNARKGGISAGFYHLLTDMSIVALKLDVTVVVTLNPLSNVDEEAQKNALEDIASSVTTVIKGQRDTWSYSSRDMDSRDWFPLSYTPHHQFGEDLLEPVKLAAQAVNRRSALGEAMSELQVPLQHAKAVDGLDEHELPSTAASVPSALDLLNSSLDDDINLNSMK